MGTLRGRLIGWIALACLLVCGEPIVRAQTTTSAPAATQPTPAAVVLLKGVVDEYSQETLIQRIEKAKAEGAKTVILQLNTPGGLVSAAEAITSYLREQHGIRTVAFVDHKALSAGIMK